MPADKQFAVDPKNKTFQVNYSAALLWYGDELLKQGKYKEAIPVLKKAVEIGSDNKPAADILAKAEAQMKPKSKVKPAKSTQ